MTETTDFRQRGIEDGTSRASWVFDGNTSDATYRRVLQGIEDGDPEILDGLGVNPLSGEYAGESINNLLGENYTEEDADQYEEGFQDGYWAEIERVARYHVG